MPVIATGKQRNNPNRRAGGLRPRRMRRLRGLMPRLANAALRTGQQLPQRGAQPRQGPSAMAQGVLDAGAQLAKGLVILGDQEEWVVTEAAAPAFLLDNDAVT